VVDILATGGRSWSFQTVDFEVFKPEKLNLLVYISTVIE